MQLTIDGREVAHVDVQRGPARARPLTPCQEDILRRSVLNRRGWIRSVEAGVIVHAHRRTARNRAACSYSEHYGVLEPEHPNGRLGCCRFAASDGGEACKRLARRGLLHRQEPGVWVLAGEENG